MKNSKQIWLITAFILYCPLYLIAQSSISILPGSQVVSGTVGTLIPLEIKIDGIESPDNFYGIAFNLSWDNTEYIEYSNLHSAGPWLGTNPLVFIQSFPDHIEAGLSRTESPGQTGSGIVLLCSLKVKAAPPVDITATLTLSNISAVQEDGSPLNLIPTGPSTVTLMGIVPVELSSFTAPENFQLGNYPNPFNPTTRIQVGIPEQSIISLIVYNALGQEIIKLAERANLDAGIYEYEWDASDVPSGIYFYRLETNRYSATEKMLLIK